MRSSRYITLAIVVFVASASSAIAADVAVNGSFEFPDIPTGGMIQPHPALPHGVAPGWDGVAWIIDSAGGSYPSSGSVGPQYADFANRRTRIASQSFSIGPGLIIASITWDATTAKGAAQTPYVARLKSEEETILETGNYLAFGLTEFNTWDSAALPIPPETYGQGNYTIEFFADQDGGSDLLADNVVIETGVPIPEPASLILLVGGSLLAIKRKRS